MKGRLFAVLPISECTEEETYLFSIQQTIHTLFKNNWNPLWRQADLKNELFVVIASTVTVSNRNWIR
jgi:hypothetical protein